MRRKSSCTLLAAGLVLLLNTNPAPAAGANQREVSQSELQDAMLTHVRSTGDRTLEARFAELTAEDWDTIYGWFVDRAIFVDAVRSVEARAYETDVAVQRESLTLEDRGWLEIFESAAQAALFVPVYPTGADYDTFTATLPGLGLLKDSDDLGTETGTALNDERCDTNGQAGALIALAVLKVVAEIGNTACSATPSPFEPATCIPAGVINEAVIADEIVLDQCNFQTALVDSAEIEAAFENSVALTGTVNAIDLVTSDETNFTSDVELGVHHTAISNQLTAHDTDVKALLDGVQDAVDENQRLIKVMMSRQLEVLRLLITQEGRRAINLDVLTCTGDDCPGVDEIPACRGDSLAWPCL